MKLGPKIRILDKNVQKITKRTLFILWRDDVDRQTILALLPKFLQGQLFLDHEAYQKAEAFLASVPLLWDTLMEEMAFSILF